MSDFIDLDFEHADSWVRRFSIVDTVTFIGKPGFDGWVVELGDDTFFVDSPGIRDDPVGG